MKNPTDCVFEEEIILVLRNIIKRSQSISQIEMTIIAQFPTVSAKYEDSLGEMFLTLSHFLYYGKEALSTDAITMAT